MTNDEWALRLRALRVEIDSLDDELIDLLARRFVLTRQVGETKRLGPLDPVDSDRESLLYDRVARRARDRGVDPEMVESMYRRIVAQVVCEHRASQSG